MKNILKVAFVAIFIAGTSFSQDPITPKFHEDHQVAEAITHVGTGTLAHAAMITSICAGTVLSYLVGGANTMYEANPFTLIFLAAGLIGGEYIVYKTPQWTDTHILKKETERTGKQNAITFASRALVVPPFGILLGEYLVKDK